MITQNKPDREEVIRELTQIVRAHLIEFGVDREHVTLCNAISLLTQQREDEKDRARLDWLEKQEDIKLSDTMLRPKYEGATWEMGFVIERLEKDDVCGNSVRECIDSAMASTSTTEEESV